MLREQEKLSLKDHINHEVVQDRIQQSQSNPHHYSIANHKCSVQMLILCNEKSDLFNNVKNSLTIDGSLCLA